jgi:hypothetical protein
MTPSSLPEPDHAYIQNELTRKMIQRLRAIEAWLQWLAVIGMANLAAMVYLAVRK